MKIKLTGYFKFSPVKTAEVKIPELSVSEILLRHSAGFDESLTKASARDAWNALAGKCAELGWYKNGGWTPHGSSSCRCAAKDMGDILGVCASFSRYCGYDDLYDGTRTWLYCDRDFEEAMTKSFFRPDEQLKFAVRYGICGAVVEMKKIPGKKWLDEFCRRTHDPDAFAMRKYGREITRAEAANAVKMFPKLAKYIKTMLMPKEG